MTLHVDWTAVDQPPLRLSLVGTRSGWYSVLDQHGSLYFPPTQDMQKCLRWMAKMAADGYAVIDDASVERATWHSTIGEGEPESGAAACAEDTSPNRLGPVQAGSSPSPVAPETFSRAVMADVIPINRRST